MDFGQSSGFKPVICSLQAAWLWTSIFISLSFSTVICKMEIISATWCGWVEKKLSWRGFPGGSAVGNLPANAGDTGSIPGPGGCHMQQSN